MKVSVALPVHNMKDSEYFLRRNLESLQNQSFKDFEVVITDNSPTMGLRYVIKEFPRLHVRYMQNKRIGMAQNTNEAIHNSIGELIKLIYLDDYLMPNALHNAVENMRDASWYASGCLHEQRGSGRLVSPHFPRYSEDIHTGNNTIGSPSVIMIRNENPLMFDERMTWLLDCDYYKRLYERYGPPITLNSLDVVMGIGDHQATNIIPNATKDWEHTYIKNKYAKQ